MISDTLSDAVADINRYLADGFYHGPLKAEIERVRDGMDRLRQKLDAVPAK